MNRLILAFLVFAAPFAPKHALASLSTASDREQMAQNLDVINNAFFVQYAPTEWKYQYAQWNLDNEIDKAKEAVYTTESLSVKEFQKIVLDFFKSTKDYHVGVHFHSTEAAFLPFQVKGVNGKYFIAQVDRSKLSPLAFPFDVGDELVIFDNKPTHQVVTDLKNTLIGDTNLLTDYGLAESLLTSRSGTLGHSIPSGPISIGVKPLGKNTVSHFQLIWEYYPEKIIGKGLKNPAATDKNSFNHPLLDTLTSKEMTVPFYKVMKQVNHPKADENYTLLGSRKSYIPTLGRVWWETSRDSSFHAYIFETPDRSRVGYIRLPHYQGGESEALEFAAIMYFFQDRTDALVIDQVNNPGGSLFYLYALASMLTDQPLHTPKHRIAISQAEVIEAVSNISLLESVKSDSDAVALLGDNLCGTPITYQMVQFILNYFRFIVDEWNSGRTLTNPYYLFGIDQINPHPIVQYTKPIVLLTNELDFSGGDFFPAILQDNKRAIILGERTAGAGGFVVGSQFPNHFGIASFHYTASIAERLDKNPIENLGVEPDIQCSLTEDDLRYNYYDYVMTIQEVIQKILY